MNIRYIIDRCFPSLGALSNNGQNGVSNQNYPIPTEKEEEKETELSYERDGNI